MAFASSNQTPSSSAANSDPTLWKVFLSFRGKDTRYGFTSHLYNVLDKSGIKTYRDTPELRSGDEIAVALPQAINESQAYVVVLSENYGDSHWCLDELVDILKLCKEMQRSVIPVFYYIDPSVVQYQKGKFIEAFEKHKNRYDADRLTRWRAALTAIGKISGYTVREKMYEGDITDKIVADVSFRITPKTLHVAKYPVGLTSRAKEVTSLLKSDSKDVIMIGIHGMGGVGKTTLALDVYNKNYHRFKGSCFLANVRENSLTETDQVRLQQQLIDNVLNRKNEKIDNVTHGIACIKDKLCSTEALIVIDDLDDAKPLDYLGPFALGSIILITTRNEDLLDSINVKARYKVNELSDFESRQLFTQHAFGDSSTRDKAIKLSDDILKVAEGLPLALTVYGEKFRNQAEKRWSSIIDSFKRVSWTLFGDKLRISYDMLGLVDHFLQNIFLDIACLFFGREEKEVVKILDTFYTDVNLNDMIAILKKRNLLRIDETQMLGMHLLLRDMGREIVRRISPRDPGKHSRLWEWEEICKVLTKSKGTEAIEGIVPHNPLEGVQSFATAAFLKMSNLRFLYLNNVELDGSFEQIFEDVTWLCWKFCPLKFLPSKFTPQKVVTLELQCSRLRTMWEVPQEFQALKSLDMSDSQDLTTIPEFTLFECLETLNLEGCVSLEEIHISSRSFKSLVSLNLRGCVRLKSLGETICDLSALKVLNIGNCEKLEALPTQLGNIDSLEVLNAEGLNVSNLPDSIGRLSKLVELKLRCNMNLTTLPNTIYNLRSLENLDLGCCVRLLSVPELPPNLKWVRACIYMINLPNLSNLKQLETLDLTDCSRLTKIQGLKELSSISILHLTGCDSSLLTCTHSEHLSQMKSTMRIEKEIHLCGAPDWLYASHPHYFMSHYHPVYSKWKSLAFERPSFVIPKPSPVVEKPPPPIVEQPPPVVEKPSSVMEKPPPVVEQSPPVVEQPPPSVSQAPSQMEVDSSAPVYSLQTPLHVSQKRPRDDANTEVETSSPHTPLHVSHKRPHADANIEIETSALHPSLDTPTSTSHTPITRVLEFNIETPTSTSHTPIHPHIIVQDMTTGPYSSETASIPTVLWDHFDIDTHKDEFLGSQRRGGRKRSGDMTRPLKNLKIRWLFRNWWSKESDFQWRKHGGRVTYILSWPQIQTLQPGRWVQDDVLNAYLELVKIRDFKMFNKSTSAKKYFFAPSFFFSRALFHCLDFGVHPDTKTPEELAARVEFYQQYNTQFTGPALVDCDYAFFPCCTGNHWILFIVDVQRSKVSLVDPLYDDNDKVYSAEFYIMEKFLPRMLHYLDGRRFPKVRFMSVKAVVNRPKQQGGSDCGIYVAKYVDAMCCGIPLNQAEWNPVNDIMTFRYRMAWELNKGVARHISECGVTQRENDI